MAISDYLFQVSPVPMLVFDTKSFKFIIVNDAAVKLYGYTKEEFLAETIRLIQPAQYTEGPEIKHITKKGKIIYVNIERTIINFEGTEAILMVSSDITEEVKIKNTLKTAAQRFKSMIQNGADMVSLISPEHNYIYLSPALLKFYTGDIDSTMMIGKNIRDFVHENDYERLETLLSDIYLKKNIQLTPFRLRNADGEWRWIETLVTNMLNDPAVGGIICNSRDVTERISNEAKIKLTVEKYNIISKATSDAIWDWNLLTDHISWNKGIKGIFGYKHLPDNSTSGKWWTMHIHPEDRERVMNNLHNHIRDKISRWKDEYRFLCADGTFKYVLDRGFMVFDEDGISVRIIGSMQDISQRKQEEQWSRLLESVVINATDAVLICTGNVEGSGQSIIYVNEAYTKMSGYAKHELIGASPRISQGPETDVNEINRLKIAIENNIPCQIEVINYTKQGNEYWVSQSNAPIADTSGTVTHWISIQRDISQNKKYVREIEEQNKKFKDIAWIQSHLVRAPLARVMGLVDLLKNFVPGEETDELLIHLESSAKELDSIIINIADKTPKSRF